MTPRLPDNLKPSTPLGTYLVAHFSYFAGASMMGVLFPWILAHYLRAPAEWVGFGQMLSQAPMVLVLLGGVAADGRNIPVHLARLQLLMTAPSLMMAAGAALQVLTFEMAVFCGILTSIIGAFIMPARDALLPQVAPTGGSISLAIASATSIMFAGQLTGFALAAGASLVGLVPLLFVQILVLTIAAVQTQGLRYAVIIPPEAQGKRRSFAEVGRDIAEGVRATARDARTRTMTLLVALSSLAMNSAFIVGLPLLVRDVYHFSSMAQATLFISFMVGSSLSAGVLARRRPIERQGFVFMLIYLNSVMVFSIIALGPPFWVTVGLIFQWGVGAGCNMVLSRSIVQQAAPPELRARILSVFQLAQMVGSPVGALIMGLLIAYFGVLNALWAVPVWSLILWSAFGLLTPIWSFRRSEAVEPDPSP